MNEKMHLILVLILELTETGVLQWKESDTDKFETKNHLIGAEIRFDYLMLGDETTSGADLCKFKIGLVEMSIFNGSPEMDVVHKILRKAFPNWDSHLGKIDSRLDRLIERLNELKLSQ